MHGIRRNLNWFKSYLTGRIQQVIGNGTLSKPQPISCGVPQGSVLGPFLFILFANDIGNFVNGGLVNCYADDTMVYCSGKTAEEASTRLQHCLKGVEYWYRENNLKVNAKKTEVMLLGTRQRLQDSNIDKIQVYFGNTQLRVVTTFKYLGLWMDSNLNWNDHCGKMAKKAGLKLHLMRRLSKILPQSTMCQVYKTYLMPILEYGATVWGFTSEESMKKAQRLINLAARIVSSNYDYINTRGADLAKKMEWSTFEERRDFLISVLMYKCYNNMAPNYMNDKVTRLEELGTRLTRHTDEFTLTIPTTRIQQASRSFVTQGPTIWNRLPINVKEATSVDSFKRRYKKHVLGLTVWEPRHEVE